MDKENGFLDSELMFATPLFAQDDSAFGEDACAPKPWKLAIIDDDQDVHAVSRLVLAPVKFRGRPIQLFSAYSGAGAQRLFRNEPDIAAVVLDVVMETEHAGLDVVKFIREELDNSLVRIILRTGQPGQAPEGQVISDYDINDYKEKSELTAQKLISTVTIALRGYDDLMRIHALALTNENLENLVHARTAELVASNQKLQRHKSLLDEAQKIASIGNYEWNLVTGEMSWSDQVYRILVITPDKVNPSLEALLENILIDDYSRVNLAIRSAVNSQQPYQIEHAIMRGDGTSGFVHQQGEVFYNKHGEPARLVGVIQDITERHNAKQKMDKLSSALEQTADAVMITTLDGTIEYVNAAFVALTGYESSEACGKTPRILKAGDVPPIFYRRLWRIILNGEVFRDTIVNRRKDGTLYHESRTITPQRDASGKVTHFISTGCDISEQYLLQERMHHLAHHDALTGLPNRVLLADRLQQAVTRSKWRNRHVAVLFLDLDRFKVINDTLGHGAGDELLVSMAKRLEGCVREGDTVARLGGDEFAVVLNDVATREDVELRALKVLEAVKDPFVYGGGELFVTTSIGISMYPQDGDDSQILLKRADVAMYNAKISGKNVYKFYTERDEAMELVKLGMETGLRRALERNEFFLVYQPLVDAATKRVVGMEALLRWRRSDGQVVPPIEFIGLLEETGMILAVGDWVLQAACEQAQALRVSGLGDLRVAVNISLHQFRKAGFVQQVLDVLARTGLDPKLLELEITEGVLVDDVAGATQILQDLNAAGVRLSIDDFGTGYSSMHYLRRLPFDALKIDKSFIDGLPNSRDDVAIVTAIITLAKSMELEVVAEGVETSAQFDFVHALGCQLIQGYIFSKPVTPAIFCELVKQSASNGVDCQPGA